MLLPHKSEKGIAIPLFRLGGSLKGAGMDKDDVLEKSLWDALDACGFQFRKTHKQLIAEHRLADVDPWHPDNHYASFGQHRALIEGLVRPMCFRFADAMSELMDVPRRMEGSVRQSVDEHANYQLAAEQLTALFGAGEDRSSSNTVGRTWTFGNAQVSVLIFPRDLNPPNPNNARHRLDPGCLTECKVTIETGYCPEANADELDAIKDVRMLEDMPFVPAINDTPSWSEYTRRVPKEMWLDNFGFGIGPESKRGGAYSDQFFMQRSAPEFFEMIPRDRIIGVYYHQSVPDRGAGRVKVCVAYTTSLDTSRELVLLVAAYKRDAYRRFAIALSHKLFTGYTETQTPFCELPPITEDRRRV